jgi:hypothetical protein
MSLPQDDWRFRMSRIGRIDGRYVRFYKVHGTPHWRPIRKHNIIDQIGLYLHRKWERQYW